MLACLQFPRHTTKTLPHGGNEKRGERTAGKFVVVGIKAISIVDTCSPAGARFELPPTSHSKLCLHSPCCEQKQIYLLVSIDRAVMTKLLLGMYTQL